MYTAPMEDTISVLSIDWSVAKVLSSGEPMEAGAAAAAEVLLSLTSHLGFAPPSFICALICSGLSSRKKSGSRFGSEIETMFSLHHNFAPIERRVLLST